MDRPDDPARIEALEAEVERLRAERDQLAGSLAAATVRGDRRRGRFEAQLERKDALLKRADRWIQRRDDALAQAQAELARPGPRSALAVEHLARRIVRRLRRLVGRGRPAPSPKPTAAVPRPPVTGASGPTDRLRATGGAVAAGPVQIALVGERADGEVLGPAMTGSSEAPGVSVAWTAGDEAAAVPTGDMLLAVSPSVRVQSLDERRVRAAWVTDPTAWIADPGFDDFDLVFVPDEPTADAVRRASAHRPVVVSLEPPDVAVATIVAALRAWHGSPWIAIHIAPKDRDVAATWGDTLFARGVQRGLRAAGWVASVHVASEAATHRAIEADVAIHISGVAAPPIHEGQPTILWVISHPDRVRAQACEAYDLVFVASDPFAEELARRLRTPVRVLHQATDPDRFYPEIGAPAHDVLFVGNSRGVKRPALTTLDESPYELAVYGGNWKPELLDPAVVKGEWIPNEDLHCYYRSAAIVLSDHWPDMRDDGFISNRVYDALASGGFVLSDLVTGIADRFEGAVATYADQSDLLEVVAEALARPDERRERAERGRAIVLARDTFDHRAAAIIDAARSVGVEGAG